MKIKEAYTYLPRSEVEYILEKILNKDRVFLHLNKDYEFDDKEFLEIVKKRKNNYPLEYIFNEAYFYGDKFFIEEGVLVPRDDTEVLIDVALKELEKFNNINIFEVGIGSGVISLTLAKYIKGNFFGSDINKKALEITKINAKNKNIDIKLFHTSLLDGVNEKIDVIISNPPYVEKEHKKPNKFEPDEAFFADDNGTYLLKEITKQAKQKKVKLVICEMGYNQRKYMQNFFEEENIKDFYFYKDYSGNDRGFVIRLN